MKYTKENIIGLQFKEMKTSDHTYTIYEDPKRNPNMCFLKALNDRTGNEHYTTIWRRDQTVNNLNRDMWYLIKSKKEDYEVY